MDRIPPEVVDRIFSYINSSAYNDTPPRVSPYSTLSRVWQRTVEQRTFRTLSVTNDDLENLGHIVVGWRRHYVRGLHVTVNFPNYDDTLSGEHETADERDSNNAIAKSSVKRLFDVLNTWGTASNFGLQLHLSFTSPGDRVTGRWGGLRGIGEKRYRFSFVSLDGAREFASAPCVTAANISEDGTRPVELRSLYDITSRLPGARRIQWHTVEAGGFALLRREIRDRFASATESASDRMPPLLDITIEEPWYYHDESLPDLIAPYAYERISSAFRQLSLGLTRFKYFGIADHTLLWPSPGQGLEPSWANLEVLELGLSIQSPSGRWYFRCEDVSSGDRPIPLETPTFRPPGYYDTEEEINDAIEYEESLERPESDSGCLPRVEPRDQPEEELIVPLLAALARAVGVMPSLQSAHLEFPNEWLGSPFFLAYAPPGRLTGYESDLSEERPLVTAPRVLAHTWSWRMDPHLEGMFRRAGTKLHGVETVVRYLPDMYPR